MSNQKSLPKYDTAANRTSVTTLGAMATDASAEQLLAINARSALAKRLYSVQLL